MIKTFGLTHIGLAVRDPERSLRFYRAVFGVEILCQYEDSIQVTTPGSNDVIAFERNVEAAGVRGGVDHFGFRLRSPDDVADAIAEVERAGGKLLRSGEFAPGVPYAFVEDPDGYELEIWFE